MKYLLKYKRAIAFLLIIVMALFVYMKYFKKAAASDSNQNSTDSEYSYDDYNLKNDSLKKLGFCVNTNFVITEDADVRRTPNKAMYNSIYNLKYGTKVYTKNIDKNAKNIKIDKTLLERETRNGFVAIYAEKPVFLSDKPVGYILKEDIIERSELKNYVPKPKQPDLIPIDSGISATIESNSIFEGESFQFSENANRHNNCVVYGDFNNDTNDDFAVVLDNSENNKSVVQIYLMNPDKKQYDLAYKKVYPSLIKIRSIPKNTKVMTNAEMTSFPIDGVQIINPNLNSYLHIYNTDAKTFMVLSN